MVPSHILMLFVLLVNGLFFPEVAYDVLQGRKDGRMTCVDAGISICTYWQPTLIRGQYSGRKETTLAKRR